MTDLLNGFAVHSARGCTDIGAADMYIVPEIMDTLASAEIIVATNVKATSFAMTAISLYMQMMMLTCASSVAAAIGVLRG